jgi:glutathione S-transferase
MAVLFALRLHGPRLDGFPALADWHTRTAERPSVAPVVVEVAAADRTLSPALATWSRAEDPLGEAAASPLGTPA